MTALAPAFERSAVGIDLAFEVGSWSYWNDEPCPYRRDEDVAEWYAGYLAASRSDHHPSTT